MRKRVVIFLAITCCAIEVIAQPGKYAGSMKKLIDKTYTDSKNIPGLKGWVFRQGSVVNSLNEPEMVTADIFNKGNTWIVFFSIKEDTASDQFVVMDVVEVKNVLPHWQISAALCRQYQTANAEIVALVKEPISQEFLKPAKLAWRFNRDKRRFEKINVKDVDCINEAQN